MNNGSKVNLLQMQRYFEGQTSRIRTISDLNLSENDYRSLGARLKSLYFFSGVENDIQDYMLSIVVYTTYSLIYGNEYESFENIMGMVLQTSQYMKRLHLRMFKETFEEYNLYSFGVTDEDPMVVCRKLASLHAGVPNSEKYIYYNLISENLKCCEVESVYKSIYEQLPYRTRYIADLIDKRERMDILMESRELVRDVTGGRMSRQEILEKYPNASMNLIDGCIEWNDNRIAVATMNK